MKFILGFLVFVFFLNIPIYAQVELDISDFDFFDEEEEYSIPIDEVQKEVTENQQNNNDQPQIDKKIENELDNTSQENQPTYVKEKQPTQPTYVQEKDIDEDAIAKKLAQDASSRHVQTDTERTTQYITISGNLGMFYVGRTDFFADAWGGPHTSNLDGDIFDPYVTLNFDIQLENNIKAVLQLQNEQRVNIFQQTPTGTLHITNRDTHDNFDFQFQKAYIQIQDFLTEGFQVRTGIIPHKYALRADGQAFFLNLGEAESPFGTRENTQAMGVFASYQPMKMIEFYVDGFYFVTGDTNFKRQDEKIYGLNFDLYLPQTVQSDEGNTISLVRFFNIIFAGIQDDNHSPIWNVGFGFDYQFGSHPDKHLFEIYGEGLFQWGEHSYNQKMPFSPIKDQHHLAYGGYLGFKWSLEAVETKPFIDVSVWYLSGDDNDPHRKKNNDLITYEDIDSTLIIEDNNYGLDIDSNYWAVKFKTGLTLTPITKEEMRLDLIYAHFQAVDADPKSSKRIGDEIDIRLTWEYSPDLIFSVAAGYLFNAYYLEDHFNQLGARGKNHAFIIRLEAMLFF